VGLLGNRARPIITANEVAGVDRLSGGRLEFGIGAGWNREEMRNHGTDPRKRMKLLQKRVEAMKAIWTEHEASYTGEFGPSISVGECDHPRMTR
jgi:alkanesulfonate monooxygenase SsuD/methylene tetrahydromethanopterin reductase-like flavin-dependent oxidoreductase (luciferase family)